jgi:hypothetical protein
MFKHELHVLVGETEIEQTLGSLNLLLNLVFVEVLHVNVHELDVNLGIVYCWSLCFLF